MVLGDRRRRSVIVKLVELAITLFVLMLPASALALTRASVSENVSALAALSAKTRVRSFEQGATKNASACTPTSARNASGKSGCAGQNRLRVHHRSRVWSPDLGAFLSPDEFGYVTTEGTLCSWPNQNHTLIHIPASTHSVFHSALATALAERGPRAANASAPEWASFMANNPGAQRSAFDAVLQASRSIASMALD